MKTEETSIFNNAFLAMLSQIDETLKQVVSGTQNIEKVSAILKQANDISQGEKENALEVAVRLTVENKKKFEELKSQIISTADKITENYRKELTDTETELKNVMGKDYVAVSEFGEYKNSIETQFAQTNEKIGLRAEDIESIESALGEYKQTASGDLAVLKDAIIAEVAESYMSKADGEIIEELISSKTEQTSKDITDTFTSKLNVVSDNLDDLTNDVGAFMDEVNAYIKRGELEPGVYGIEVGRSDSNFKTRFTNDELAFYQGEVKVAYVSNSTLYITRAEILDYIQIGNADDGYFIFDVTTHGLEVRYNG